MDQMYVKVFADCNIFLTPPLLAHSVFSVRRRHCQLPCVSSSSGWPGTTKSVENTPGSPTQPNCWKDASKIVPQLRGIPNLAVLWLSWSERDFIGGLVRRADLSCWHFNLGSEIWLPPLGPDAKSCGSTKGREQT